MNETVVLEPLLTPATTKEKVEQSSSNTAVPQPAVVQPTPRPLAEVSEPMFDDGSSFHFNEHDEHVVFVDEPIVDDAPVVVTPTVTPVQTSQLSIQAPTQPVAAPVTTTAPTYPVAIDAGFDVTLDRSVLLKALGHLQSIVERRTASPVLSNVRLIAYQGQLQLTTTDTEIAMTETISAVVDQPGGITVHAHTLYEIIRKLPDGAQVSLLTSQDQEGKIQIRSGSSRFSLSTLPVANYPIMEAGSFTHHFALLPTEWKELLDKTRFAMSLEESRFYLNGIYLHVARNGQDHVFRAVSTDGHRLACVDVALPEGLSGFETGVILPRKTVLELRKIIEATVEPVQLSLSTKKIRIVAGNIVLISKLIDATYPDYTLVIPTQNEKIMEAPLEGISKAVDRVATVTTERSRSIIMKVATGKVNVSAFNEEGGTASEDVDVKYGADDYDIAFNSRYLLELFHVIEGDTVQFVFGAPGAPALVRDTASMGALFVLMPISA